MSATPQLQRLSAAELDPLLAKLRREGTTELILLGSDVLLFSSRDQWPPELLDNVYQLTERVEGLAEKVAALTQLTTLCLIWAHIGDEGAASLATLKQLAWLDLSYNEIGDGGAASLSALTQLTSLELAGNQIGEEGAASLATLTQLTSLVLSENQIGPKGAASLASLQQLTSLDLSHNQIGEEGAASLATLTQLTSLVLSENQIGPKGAASLASLSQLSSLDLSRNQIGEKGAACLATLKHLTSLQLSDNRIGDAGAASLAALTKLNFLTLSYNQVGDAGSAFLGALTQLTWLDLSNNPVKQTSPFASLPRLTHLNLAETKVEDLSPMQGLLEGGLEVKWERFRSDAGVNVYGCPLIHPPPEIVERGQEAVLSYLREIERQGLDHLYEAKVLILGEGGAGKTSLLRRLYRPDLPLPAEEESTKGIDIQSHEYATAEGKPFRLNVWDFGGQQIYHASHQFFLTKRSLYILVDDTKNNDKTVHDSGFKTWLEMIEALSDRSPVLIFQNEKAGRSKKIDEAGIKGRHPNVKDVFRGNLEQPESARQLQAAIHLYVQQLPHVGEAVPAKWLAIRSALEERKQRNPFLRREEYFQIYKDHLEWDKTKALRLSQYFHDLGVFLHFQEDPLLARRVILQNEWATDAVFKVLDDEPTKARSGYFNREDCQRIWADSTYADMHPELLALMEKFELCYKLSDQPRDTWLMPQLLPPSAPEVFKDWEQAGDLVLIYSYDFLPRGLINRLMVRMHRFVRQSQLSWGSGAYFEQGSSELLAQLTAATGQEIELRARGPERKALLSVIASDLDALNASFEGLKDKVRKLVPCNCKRCKPSTTPQRFEEARLLKRKQDGKLRVECPESYEEVSVLELLDGLKWEALPLWAASAENQLPAEENRPPLPTGSRSSKPLKTIKIFLASSCELRKDRDAFERHFLQKNKDFRRQGFEVEVLRWETSLDAMSETRLQDEYNQEIRNCDIFLCLIKTKIGRYTEEEFDVAHEMFQKQQKPLIYTYFKDVPITTGSITEEINTLLAFKKKLSELGHYHTEFNSSEDLILRFRDQLEQLLHQGKL